MVKEGRVIGMICLAVNGRHEMRNGTTMDG